MFKSSIDPHLMLSLLLRPSGTLEQRSDSVWGRGR